MQRLEDMLNKISVDTKHLLNEQLNFATKSKFKSLLSILSSQQNYHKVLRKEAQRASNKLELSKLVSLFTEHAKSQIFIYEGDYFITIDFWIAEQRDLFFKIKDYQLPDIFLISLDNVLENDTNVINSFLENSIPERLNSFNFCPTNSQNLRDWRIHLDSLWIAAESIMKEFYVEKMDIKGWEFEALLVAFKHWEKLTFRKWVILTDKELNLSLITSSNIRYINLCRSGLECYSDWKQNIHRLKNILRGISCWLPLN